MSMDQQQTFTWLVERSNRLEAVEKENAALKARLRSAEAKAQALDWLSEQTTRKIDGLWCDYSREQWVIRFNGSPVRYYSSPTLLAAIQAAQAGEQEKP